MAVEFRERATLGGNPRQDLDGKDVTKFIKLARAYARSGRARIRWDERRHEIAGKAAAVRWKKTKKG